MFDFTLKQVLEEQAYFFERHCLLQDLYFPLVIILLCKGLKRSGGRKKSGFKPQEKQIELRSDFESACANLKPNGLTLAPLEKSMPVVISTIAETVSEIPRMYLFTKQTNPTETSIIIKKK